MESNMRKYTANSPDEVEMSFKKDNGCFVKATTGFILVFLALIVALGVGLIVHFVEKDMNKDPSSSQDSLTTSPLSPEKLTQQCKDIAKAADDKSKSVCK